MPYRPAAMCCIVALTACGTYPTCDVTNSAQIESHEQTGPLMRPGQNCIRCHVAGGIAGTADSAGGSVLGGLGDILFGKTGPRGGKHEGLAESMARSAVRTIGSSVGREIVRGVLGGILGSMRKR